MVVLRPKEQISTARGVEVAADWRSLPDWRFTAAYTFNDQIYTDYVEQLSAGGNSFCSPGVPQQLGLEA